MKSSYGESASARAVPLHDANVAGLAAMSLWSATALLLSFSTAIPPILAAALTSLLGFFAFVLYWVARGRPLLDILLVPAPGLLVAVVGIGGYRLLYFAAFAYAPALDVSLTNYLWPLLIVMFTTFLPGEVLRWHHVVGASLGFSGVCLLYLRDGGAFGNLTAGHALALAAAVVWAAFSVASRHTKHYSSDVVPVSFLITGLVFLVVHFFAESPALHVDALAWAAIAVLGFSGSTAYFLWDVAMKRGNIQALSALSYAVPLASTLLLIAFGKADASPTILLSAVLVVLGGMLAAKDTF